MKNTLGPFQRLQWKLTLSYTLVTVVTIFVLTSIMMVVTNQFNASSDQFGVTLALALQDSTLQIAEIFQAPIRDEELQKWVDKSVIGNSVLLNNLNIADGNGISFVTVSSQETLLAIVDSDGQTLAANHPELELRGKRLSNALTPRSVELLQTALNSGSTQRLWYREAHQIFAAAPILGADGRVLGAVFMRFVQASQLTLLGISLLSILPVMLLVTIGAGVIGTLFGALNARNLTRRLVAIAQATKAWGMGDFSTRIKKTASDEISQLANELNHMADDLQTLVQTREDLAAAEERNRLSRDLHDSVKQQVFAIRMNLGVVKTLWNRQPAEALDHLEKAVELVGQAQHELSALIRTLRPAQLEELGLAAALREIAEGWQGQSGMTIRCQVEEMLSLAKETESALYRIAQEALANAARHSRANLVELTLTANAGTVCLQIRDDGQGFNPMAATQGLGLHSMRERAQALGGSFHIESGPKGTLLEVILPVKEKANE
jgi:NarL family two-component system sensor histidine kinase LiaS